MELITQDNGANLKLKATLESIHASIMQCLVSGTRPETRAGGQEQTLQPADIEKLEERKAKIASLIERVGRERAIEDFDLGIICDCPVHVACMNEVGISSLMDFAEAEPFFAGRMLKAAENRGAAPQLHLWNLLQEQLDRQVRERPREFFRREINRENNWLH